MSSRSTAAAAPRRRFSPEVLVVACAVAYTLWFAFWCSWRLLSFRLGMDWVVISNSVVWASRGYLFRSAIRGLESYSFWQEHFSPILLFYVPFFKIDGTFALLVMVVSQAVANGLAGWLLFRLGRIWLRNDTAALCGSLLWFANGRVQLAILHDFHKFTLSPLFLTLSFWGAAAGRRNWMWAGFAGTLLLREDAFLALLGLPLYLFFLERRRREALAMVCIIVAWELLVFKAIFPALGQGYRFFGYYDWLAPGPGALLKRILTEPLAVLNTFLTQRDNAPLVRFLSLYGFLPLLSPGGWLTGIFAMSESLLSNARNLTGYFYHYVVPPAAMLTIGTLLSLRFWSARLAGRIPVPRLAVGVLTVLTLYNLQQDTASGAMPWSWYLRSPDNSVNADLVERVRSANALAALIPAAEPAEFSFNLFSRWQARPGAWPYKGRDAIRPGTRWLLLDHRARRREFPDDEFVALVRTGEWRVVASEGAVFLFARGRDPHPGAKPILLRWFDPLGFQTAVGAKQLPRRLVGLEGKPGWLASRTFDAPPPGRYRLTLFLESPVADGEVCEVSLAAKDAPPLLQRVVRGRELRQDRPLESEFIISGPAADLELRIFHRGAGALIFSGGRLDWLGDPAGLISGGDARDVGPLHRYLPAPVSVPRATTATVAPGRSPLGLLPDAPARLPG